MENLREIFIDTEALLKKEKITAALSLPDKANQNGEIAEALEGLKKLRLNGKKQIVPDSCRKKYGSISKEAAIVLALKAKYNSGTKWGLAVTDLSLIPSPLSGDPQDDGDTDTSTLFIAVTDGKKAAVQQLAAPGDLLEEDLAEAALLRAVSQGASLLTGLLSGDPSAKALLHPVSSLKRYARSPFESFAASILPWKGDRPGDVTVKLILIAAVAAVVVTGSMTVTEQTAVKKTETQIQTAVEIYTTQPTEEEESSLPDNYLSKFASLYAVNQDVKGWLTIPNTNIDFPIMQADDNDYYLSHDLYGDSDPYGLPYIDYRVPIEKNYWAKNTIIYGHNMNAGYVFHELIGYRDADFYKEHPFLTFDTIYNESEWVVFAAFEANTDFNRGEVFQYFNYVTSTDTERAQWYIDETTSRSYFTCSVDVNTEDTFLTLQTCSNNSTDTKLCIVARKLREGESESDFDFSSSVNNANRVKPTFY